MKMCWCWRKKVFVDNVESSPPMVVNGSTPSELDCPESSQVGSSFWGKLVMKDSYSSWSLPKRRLKDEFQNKFDEYLALDDRSEHHLEPKI